MKGDDRPGRATTSTAPQSATTGRQSFSSLVATERARLQAEKQRRRTLVLAHPELALRLTSIEFLPYPYSDPQLWDGFVPEPYDKYLGRKYRDGTKAMTTERVESGQRLALLRIIGEAERRVTEGSIASSTSPGTPGATGCSTPTCQWQHGCWSSSWAPT